MYTSSSCLACLDYKHSTNYVSWVHPFVERKKEIGVVNW